jgi:hypothetical protein
VFTFQNQVRDVDLLEEVLESINQELPDDIKASLKPISQLSLPLGRVWTNPLLFIPKSK